MLRCLPAFGAAAAAAFALGGCAVSTPESERASRAPAPEIEIEAPLALSVDRVDVSHGGLRVSATMDDGSADVSVWLDGAGARGASCAGREVGSGIATASSLVWTLSIDDVARASGCGLVVKARGPRTAQGRTVMVARLPLALTVTDGEDADGPRLVAQSPTEEGAAMRFEFVHSRPSATLLAGDEVLRAAQVRGDEGRGAPEPVDETAPPRVAYEVPALELARALVTRRPLALDGEEFPTTVSVGGAQLEEEQEEEEVVIGSDGEDEGASEVEDDDEDAVVESVW